MCLAYWECGYAPTKREQTAGEIAMKIVGTAAFSLALFAIACGAENQSSDSERRETPARIVNQSLTRTTLVSANFQTGLAPFTNPGGG